MGLLDDAKVTDLFVEGDTLELSREPLTTVWVNKLNAFEREECQRDGQAARSRMILNMKEPSSADKLAYDAVVSRFKEDSEIIAQLCDAEAQAHFIKAVETIQQDPEWEERLAANSRLSNVELNDEDKATVGRVDEEYNDELTQRQASYRSAYEHDLAAFDHDSLLEKYYEEWLDKRSYASFRMEFTTSQVWFSIRNCEAVIDADKASGWDHAKCDHSGRAIDKRESVRSLPDQLFERLVGASGQVQLQPRQARFSDALASSSGSSAPQSEAAESPVSTPVETSPEPATISSSPSEKP